MLYIYININVRDCLAQFASQCPSNIYESYVEYVATRTTLTLMEISENHS